MAWVDIRHLVLFPAMSNKRWRLIDNRTFRIFELLVDRGLFTFMSIGLGTIKVMCRDFIPNHQWNINNYFSLRYYLSSEIPWKIGLSIWSIVLVKIVNNHQFKTTKKSKNIFRLLKLAIRVLNLKPNCIILKLHN